MIFIVLLALLLTLIYYKVIKPYSYWTDRCIKQRKQIYIFGDFFGPAFGRESLMDMALNVYRAYPKEKLTGMYQLMTPILMLKDPEIIKRITVKDFDHFVDHQSVKSVEADDFLNKNLIALKGDKWHDMRSTLSPSFTSSKIKGMFYLISETASTFVEYFVNAKEETITLEMKDVLTKFTNDVIATSAFGIKCDSMKDPENEFYIMGKNATNTNGIWNNLKVFIVLFLPKISKKLGMNFIDNNVRNFFAKIVTETIKTREENNIIRPDMLHLLMEARKGKLKDEEKQNTIETGFATIKESKMSKHAIQTRLTDLDITAQAFLFFFAGFETVSSAMSFMVHELAIHPDVQQKLQVEIDSTLSKCEGVLTYEALMQMRYMDMVVSESLRLWPPAVFTDRVCVKPYTIDLKNGEVVRLENGDVVNIPIIGFHRDPKYFPNPDVFDPERFSEENKHNIQQYTYFPFGVGPRSCIGSRLALMELKTLFFHLLSRFDLVPVDKTQIPLKLKKTVNVSAERGFWIGLKRRTTII